MPSPVPRHGRRLILCGLLALSLSACGPRLSLPAPLATVAVIPATLAPATLAASPTLPPASVTAMPASPSALPATPTATPSEVPPTPTEPPPTPTAGPLGPTLAGRIENFELVGRHALGSAGWHAGLALVYPCAYIGNRRVPQVAILDVTDPAEPALAGHLSLPPGSQPVEIRAVPDLGLLVVLNFQPQATVLTFDVSDCRHPRPLGVLALGAVPHEFFLWRDPIERERVLLYAAMWNYQRPDMHVVDLTNPTQPRWLGGWTSAAEGLRGSLHSLSLSPDGRLAYLAMWEGGLLLADTSDFAAGLPDPQLRLLRDGTGFAPAPGRSVHTALPLSDPRYVLLTEEIYACPFAGLMVADTLRPSHPQIVGRFALPENAAGCGALPQPDAVFTAHNPLVVGSLAFVTWYGGGLQVLDLSDPAQPRRVALYVPDGQGAAHGSYIGSYAVQLWSYPILRQGLLYVADIQSGLHILRYTGPEADLVNSLPLAEGNVTVLQEDLP